MPKVDLSAFTFPSDDREFSVERDDFNHLEIRDAEKGTGLFYFYDTKRRRLVTDFILKDRANTAIMCTVTLIKKPEGFTPRLKLWTKDKKKAGKSVEMLDIPDLPETRQVKAQVDASDAHDEFWHLMGFLSSLQEVDTPSDAFSIVELSDAQIVSDLRAKDKNQILEVIQSVLGSSLTDQDISLIANRKVQLAEFRRLLTEKPYFLARAEDHGGRHEAVWQKFFEDNPWIFGYGLQLVSVGGLDDRKLERYTSGANIFTGAGKRADAIMRSRGYIGSLLFGEIKTHEIPLLQKDQYRKPDVYHASTYLTGSVAQVQKTAHKAMRQLNDQIKRLYESDGTPTGIEFSTTRPRQVVLIGSLSQFSVNGEVNPEQLETFELYRTTVQDTEIITFDELFERASFIVGDRI